MSIDPRELKRAALVGLRHEQQRIADLIQRLERELGTSAAESTPVAAGHVRRKRRMSAAGRRAIAAATKARWAAYRKAKEAPKAEARPKVKRAAAAKATATKKAAAKVTSANRGISE